MLSEKYYIKKIFEGINVLDLKVKLEEQLKDYGFGILTEIDVKDTMKRKINKEYDDFLILGLCNPNFADNILSENKDFAIFLPCTAIIYKEGDKTILTIANPEEILPSELKETKHVKLANKVRNIFEEVLSKL